MNGFTHSILSLLLTWIRTLISSLWSLFGSEEGGLLYRFLSEKWLMLLAVLCIGGIAVDLLVYLFRWRPYYVWLSRLRRLRRGRTWTQAQEEAHSERYANEDASCFPDDDDMQYAPMLDETRVYAPSGEPFLHQDDVVWDADEAPLEDGADAPFGAFRPEPRPVYQHIQAGYAPPIPPEQLYAPSASYQPPRRSLQACRCTRGSTML